MTTTQKLIFAFLAAVQVVLLSAAPAAAVNPGRNGKIAFTSGREGANDNNAQIYLIKRDGTGLSDPLGIPGTQNRHASFSPDRTRMVFAAGTPGPPTTEEYDLFVRDLVDNTIAPLDATQLGDGLSSDHPAWSPDGTQIAYETQPVDNGTDRNIMVKTFPSGKPAVPLTTGPATEFKPAWSPDGGTIYYAKTVAGPPVNHNIVKRPAEGGAEVSVADTLGDEYQPSISPDGTKICFTLQTTAGNTSTAEIAVGPLSDLNDGFFLTNDGVKGDINCSWSPDGTKIAYTHGVFSQGALVTENADGSSSIPTPVTDDQGSNNFDGNAEWVADGSPECGDKTVRTEPETPITLELECTDTGPAYERSNPNGTVANDGQPENGTLSDDSPLTDPSTVVYTPDPGFTGTDEVEYIAFDDAGFGTDRGTITIQVGDPAGEAGRCAGHEATISGTDASEVLRGTPGADVIAAGAGNDRVRAGNGGDVVCGGAGKDRLAGGGGKDRLKGRGGKDRVRGGSGRDRLHGGASRDRCAGGPGRDRTRKCEVSR